MPHFFMLSRRSVVPCLTLLCLSLALLLAAPDARAGSYVGANTIPVPGSNPVTYTQTQYNGGFYVVPGPTGTPVPLSDGVGTTQNLAAGYGGDSGGITASCFGAITASWNWTHGPGENDANDPPPAQVIITESCSVEVTVVSPMATGSYDTGMGETGTVSWSPGGSNTKTATHVRYSVLAGGASVALPAVNASAVAASPGDTASVRYAAAISPVTINLSNVKVDTDGSLKLLTGQQVEASLNLNGGPGNLSNFNWSVVGDGIYGAYLPSESAAQIQPFDTSESSVFFHDKTGGDKISVSCTATVTFPDGTTSSVSATAPMINVLKPTMNRCDINGIKGVNYSPSNFNNSPIYYGAREIWAPIVITVPDPFGSVNGSACIAQIIRDTTFQDTRSTSGEPTYVPQMEIAPYGIYNTWVPVSSGLDCIYPYPFTDIYSVDGNGDGSVMPSNATSWNAPGTGAAEDNPSVPCTPPLVAGDTGTDWNASSGQDDFYTWIMYSPDGSSWVPLSKISWTFLGSASLSGGAWQGGSGASSSGASATDEFPERDLIVPYSGTGHLRYGPAQ